MPSWKKGWSPTLEVEELFSSYGRVKVLSVMLESGELNISEITRRTRLSHESTANHLRFLVQSGLLTEKRFNRIRIFRLERTRPAVAVLSRFFAEWERLKEKPFEQPFN